MRNTEEKIWKISAALSLTLAVVPMSQAMHIMEGYLPPAFCVAWGILCIPFLIKGFFQMNRKVKENSALLTMMAMAGAFIFVISALKIPSVAGSSSHMTGTGLGAMLVGPFCTSILGIIVLLFQAVLLAHGGLTTLGANTFSMAIAGPFLTYALFRICKKLGVNHKVSIFMAAALGDVFTYCVTSLQLALAHPAKEGGILGAAFKFLAVFVPTQLPLAILEGIITVTVVIALEKYALPELKLLGFVSDNRRVS